MQLLEHLWRKHWRPRRIGARFLI